MEILFSQPGLGRFKIFDATIASATAVENREGLLKGRVIVVTGGIRGIGKEVTDRLVRLGAIVYTPHRDPGKEKRAERGVKALESEGAPGKMISVICDLTNPADIQRLANQIKTEQGHVDDIVLNAAGGLEDWADDDYAEKINATSKVDLVYALAPLMVNSKQPKVLEDTSAWSKYYSVMEQLPDYERVARSKKHGEIEVTEIIQDLNATRLNTIVRAEVCGHLIDKTTTGDGFRRKYPEKMAEVEKTAIGGKFPDISEMADEIVGTIVDGFEDGHVAFVGIPHLNEEEVNSQLGLYNKRSRKIRTVAFAQPGLTFGQYNILAHDMQSVSSVKEGKLVLTSAEDLAKEPNLPDAILTTDDEEVDGHFEGNNPKIVPLWKLAAAAMRTATLKYKQLTGNVYHVAAASGIDAKSMVLPSDQVSIYLKPELVGEAGYAIVRLGVDLKVFGSSVDTFESITIEEGVDPNEHLKPLILEAAALTNGLDSLHQLPRPGVVPLYKRVESIKFANPQEFATIISEGTELVTQSKLDSNIPEAFSAQAITRVGLKQFAEAKGIECGFMEKEKAIALYNAMVSRRQKQKERRAEKAGN